MCKIRFKIAFDAFHRWIKISVFEIREFFLNQFHQLFYSDAVTGFSYINFLQVQLGSILKLRHWIMQRSVSLMNFRKVSYSSTLSVIPGNTK